MKEQLSDLLMHHLHGMKNAPISCCPGLPPSSGHPRSEVGIATIEVQIPPPLGYTTLVLIPIPVGRDSRLLVWGQVRDMAM